jgi:hypothetical protein
MSDFQDSVYPDILRTGLTKLNQTETRGELLALFSALEHLRQDLHAQDTAKGILRIGHRYLSGLDIFDTAGFWLVNPKDMGFDPEQIEPAARVDQLCKVVEVELRAGRFARALKAGGPVFFHATIDNQPRRGMFHSMALSSQVVGMFCAVLKNELTPVHEITFSLLSLVLGQIADALVTLHKTAHMADQIATLSGLLPVCAWCKRVRDDQGYWEQIEKFIASRSAAAITHSICPECMVKMERDIKSHGK